MQRTRNFFHFNGELASSIRNYLNYAKNIYSEKEKEKKEFQQGYY
jgi:hypothetical protein